MKICVAVPTDDGKLVKIGHFGMESTTISMFMRTAGGS